MKSNVIGLSEIGAVEMHRTLLPLGLDRDSGSRFTETARLNPITAPADRRLLRTRTANLSSFLSGYSEIAAPCLN